MNTQGIARLAILAFIAVTVAGLLLRPLIPAFETRYASVAWAMYLDRDFLVPHLNGALYPHKQPLLFWLINLVWWLTGVSEFAARLVAPEFAAGSLFLVGNLAHRLWPEDRNIGAYATIILASMSALLIPGVLTMFDAMLTFATILGMIALVAAVREIGGADGVPAHCLHRQIGSASPQQMSSRVRFLTEPANSTDRLFAQQPAEPC